MHVSELIGLFVQPCVRKPVWTRPWCPLASCCPSSCTRCGNWIREELFFHGPCRRGCQSITGVRTHTQPYQTYTHTITQHEWNEFSVSSKSKPGPRIYLSKVIHQKMTLALLQRSFKMLRTMQQTFTQAIRTGTKKHAQLRAHSLITAASITYTEGETNRALCWNVIAVTWWGLPRTTPALLSYGEARLKVCQYVRLTEVILSQLETSWYSFRFFYGSASAALDKGMPGILPVCVQKEWRKDQKRKRFGGWALRTLFKLIQSRFW